MKESTTCRTEPHAGGGLPAAMPLNEALRAPSAEKGRAHGARMRATLLTGLKGLSMMALVAGATYWSNLLPYDGVARFALSAGALAAALLFFLGRRYAMAAVSGAVALVFNPIAPALTLAGDWRRTLLVVMAVLLVASFAGFEKRKAQND